MGVRENTSRSYVLARVSGSGVKDPLAAFLRWGSPVSCTVQAVAPPRRHEWEVRPAILDPTSLDTCIHPTPKGVELQDSCTRYELICIRTAMGNG